MSLGARQRLGLALLLACAALLALFAGDYVVFRMQSNPQRAVVVSRYYAVKQKNGKVEFIFQPPQAQSCVNALFAHAGYLPCWYLERHREQRIDI